MKVIRYQLRIILRRYFEDTVELAESIRLGHPLRLNDKVARRGR